MRGQRFSHGPLLSPTRIAAASPRIGQSHCNMLAWSLSYTASDTKIAHVGTALGNPGHRSSGRNSTSPRARARSLRSPPLS